MISMKKQKYTFSLSELTELDDELNGRELDASEKEGSEEEPIFELGLLDDHISLKLKFVLTHINQVVQGYLMNTQEFRNKLIYKLGTPNATGVPEIPIYQYEVEDGKAVAKPHPDFVEFEKVYNEYLTKEITIESYPIDLNLLEDVKRSERFPKLMKYIEQQMTEE
jgi:hypothetical protein